MNNRILYFCVVASLLVHAVTILTVSLIIRIMPAALVHVPIDLVNVQVAEMKAPEALPPAPTPKPKAVKITTPKLLSKPEIIETPAIAPTGNTKDVKEPEKRIEAKLASLPPEAGSVKGGWNVGERPGEAEGGAAGAEDLFGKGDVGVMEGRALSGDGGGTESTGLGRGTKGDGTGGGGGSGDALSSLARPLGGYQIKPSYPESARRSGVQGTTVLKLRVLENGKVGEVQIEKSAGHPDLDMAAVDAVRKWLFEPARIGKQPLAVWVLLPVKFELN